jgi:lipoprotein-anchoring transpeptidase ErfK/SrfK
MGPKHASNLARAAQFGLVCGLVLTALAGCKRFHGQGDPGPVASESVATVDDLDAVVVETLDASEDPVSDAILDAGADVHPDFDWLPPRTVKAGGPHKIGAKAMQAWVHLYPDDETPYLGYIRAGRVVDRSDSWIVKTVRCQEGWYEVLPEGYVCNGNRATLDLKDPIVVASWKQARRGEPLPYNYVRPADRNAFLYFTLPSKKDQLRTEGQGLETHVGNRPTERIPNIDVLGEPEPVPAFLADGKHLHTPFGATKRLRYNVHEGRANPQAAFALMSVHDYEGRRFGLTTELDLIALDRTRIIRPSTRRGSEVEDLPAGIVRALSIPRYVLDDSGNPIKDGSFSQFQIIDLTGKTYRNYWEVRDGSYVTAGAVQMVEPRTSFPSFAVDDRKWVDVGINDQLLVAYIGKRAVYVAQISTGLGGVADPARSFATVRGSFTVKSKHVTATMTGSQQADDYELADVPYVQYFQEGYALHGTFWHDNFGRTQSHGCVNLTPADSAWVFEFTDPPVPEHWHGVVGHENTPRSVVHVRP